MEKLIKGEIKMAKTTIVNEAVAAKIVVKLTDVGVRRKDGWYVGDGKFVYDPTSSGFRAQVKEVVKTTKWGYKSAGFITSVEALDAFIAGDNSKLVGAGVKNMMVAPKSTPKVTPKSAPKVKSTTTPKIWFNKSGNPSKKQVEKMGEYGIQNVDELVSLGVTKKQCGYIIHIADPDWRNTSPENKRYSDYKLGEMGVVLGAPVPKVAPKIEKYVGINSITVPVPVEDKMKDNSSSDDLRAFAVELLKVANAILNH
jgi:hypothetical protein